MKANVAHTYQPWNIEDESGARKKNALNPLNMEAMRMRET